MFVVYNLDTGESTEAMRFGSEADATQFLRDHLDPDFGQRFAIRRERW
jgi:hypothetical protein